MKRIAILFSVFLLSVINAEDSLSRTISLLQDNCIKCHGKVVNEKKRIKGRLDLSEVLEKGIHLEDSAMWARALEQIEFGQMPPPDNKLSLSPQEVTHIATTLRKLLYKKTLPARMLTASEIKYSMQDLFDTNVYVQNPFAVLEQYKNLDSKYPTINSSYLMGSGYLKELDESLQVLMQRYVMPYKRSNHQTKFDKQVNPLDFHESINGSSATVHFGMRKFSSEPGMKAEKDRVGRIIDAKERAEEKQEYGRKAKIFIDKLKAEGRDLIYDFRMSNPTGALKKTFSPGKYSITFTANALNRELVQKAYSAKAAPASKSKSKGKSKEKQSIGLGSFERLLHEKAKIAIYQTKPRLGARSNNDERDYENTLIHTFSIEDNVKKEYTAEFEINVPFGIVARFINGPLSSRVKRLSLNRVSAKEPWGDDYKLPCVRIYDDMKMKKIEDISQRSEFDFYRTSENEITHEMVDKKIQILVNKLSLNYGSERLQSLFDAFPKEVGVMQRYIDMMKLIVMSSDNMYVNFSNSNFDEAARFISYSLLKMHPTERFKKDYRLFKSGEMSSKSFASIIIENPKFERFIEVFNQNWLEQNTELDIVKFGSRVRELPFKKETNHYLKHLFRNNLPAIELFHSNYKILNLPLALFYGENIDKSLLGTSAYALVKTKDKASNGVINQGSFFVANSSGVDPQPFKRAKWISENIFNKKLPNPPNDVDAEVFSSTKELKTFKERTEFHAKNEACYSCHKVLDPIAFAMHNFGTLGDRIAQQDADAEKKLKLRVSAASETVAKAFTRNLISFIVGRDCTVFDDIIADKIVQKTKVSHHGVKDILALITEVYFK